MTTSKVVGLWRVVRTKPRTGSAACRDLLGDLLAADRARLVARELDRELAAGRRLGREPPAQRPAPADDLRLVVQERRAAAGGGVAEPDANDAAGPRRDRAGDPQPPAGVDPRGRAHELRLAARGAQRDAVGLHERGAGIRQLDDPGRLGALRARQRPAEADPPAADRRV